MSATEARIILEGDGVKSGIYDERDANDATVKPGMGLELSGTDGKVQKRTNRVPLLIAVEEALRWDAREDTKPIHRAYASGDKVPHIRPYPGMKLNLRLADAQTVTVRSYLKRDAVGTWVTTTTATEAEAEAMEAVTSDSSDADTLLVAARIIRAV